MISADFNINIICYNVRERATLCTSVNLWTLGGPLYEAVITKKLQMFTFWDFFSDFTNTLLPIGRWHSFIVWLLSSIISFLEDSGNLLSVRENR